MPSSRKTHGFKSPGHRCVLTMLALIVALLIGCQSDTTNDDSVVHRLEGQTMGTTWSVQLRTPELTSSGSDPGAKNEIAAGQQAVTTMLATIQLALDAELLRINQLMSTWDPDSQLSLFNNALHVEPIELHQDTLKVIDSARRISHLTQGRYDITLGPVIQLWGFGTKLMAGVPSDDEITDAMKAVGSVLLVRSGTTLRKRHPKLSIDVSSLAKGYAVDQLGVILESLGVTHYLVEIGGELRARGFKKAESAWQVGIEQPDGDIDEGLYLQDAQVASSGSYRNYREEDGRRVSHIIDGTTGRPIDHRLVAVTVLHESTMLADAWATALLVVGETAARQYIEQLGLDAQLTLRINDEFELYRSDGFQQRLVGSL